MTKQRFQWETRGTSPSLIPEKRNWMVRFRGVKKPEIVKGVIAGKEQEVAFNYDGTCATATVLLNNIAVVSSVELASVGKDDLLYDNSGARNRILNLLIHSQMAYKQNQ